MNSPEYTVKAPVMGPEIMFSGFVVCSRPASTNPQFATGPQKCVVFGPVGELMNFMSADDIAAAARCRTRAHGENCRGRDRGCRRRDGASRTRRRADSPSLARDFDRHSRL